MSDARQNLEAARSIGADRHAPQIVDNAQQLLAQAENEMQNGDYKAAQKDAVASHQAARQALTIAQTKQQPSPIAVTPEPGLQVSEPLTTEPAMPSDYLVETKDNLWRIAAKPEIYGDAQLWPLLLNANSDIIKNSHIIKPGTTLHIKRTLSAEEIEAALNFSHTAGSTPLKIPDTSQLRHSGLR